jgi:hypothetical protein
LGEYFSIGNMKKKVEGKEEEAKKKSESWNHIKPLGKWTMHVKKESFFIIKITPKRHA